MRRLFSVVFTASLLPMLSACGVGTVVGVVTAPVRAAGQVADWATTSQDEADRSLGRRTRAREAEIGRLERRRTRLAEQCDDGNRDACNEAEEMGEDIADLRANPV